MPWNPPAHSPYAWQNLPSTATPIDSSHLQAGEQDGLNFTIQVAQLLGLGPTSVKNASYVAVAGDFVPCDISAGSITITLPSAPADQSRLGVKIIKTTGTNTVTVAAGGGGVFNIVGGNTTLTLAALYQGVLLQYSSSNSVWYVTTADTPLGVASGAAKLGTDGTVGGPGGSALTNSVVTGIRPETYGAQGDGATDDTAAFVTASGAAGTGGNIVLGAKTYVLNNFDFQFEEQGLTGAGRGVTKLKAKAGASYAVGMRGVRWSMLRDLTVDGNANACDGVFIEANNTLHANQTSQGTLFERVLFQNCINGCHIGQGVGVTQADKNLLVACRWVGNNVGLLNESANGQQTMLIGYDFILTVPNSVAIKIKPAPTAGSPDLNLQSGQFQILTTGCTGILLQGIPLGTLRIEDHIDESSGPAYVSIDGSVGWPTMGAIFEHAIFQGATANVLMGQINAATVGGVIHATECGFYGTGGTGLGGNGIIKTFAIGTPTKVVLKDCNPQGNAPQFVVNAGAFGFVLPGEAPRQVGAAGQPGFAAGWQNSASGFQPLTFSMDRSGYVTITGMVTPPGGTGGSALLFTLPAGYRPSNFSEGTAFDRNTGAAPFSLLIQPDGRVYIESAIVANHDIWVSARFAAI